MSYTESLIVTQDLIRLYDPLEQFDVLPLIKYYNYFIFLRNIDFFVALIFLAIFLLSLEARNNVSNLSNLSIFTKKLFDFVKSIVIENMVLPAQKYFPLIIYMFLFLFFCNVIGMFPYSFTLSSSFTITFYLALGLFIGLNIIGCKLQRSNIFNLFLPGGAPLLIAPFLVIIELISYIARVFSLAIRLFANMMSGHTLLKILAGFAWNILKAGLWSALLFIIPLGIVFVITGLELCIAFLQAYVFTVLMCIYINDVFDLH